MIKGVHIVYFTTHADEMRAFLRDKLDLAHADVGDGWLIFKAPPTEMAPHPFDPKAADSPKPSDESFASISFYCDDIHQTIREMKKKGVRFTSEVSDVGYGLSVKFLMAADTEVDLYEPKYATRFSKSKRPPR